MSQGVGLASCLPKTAWPPTCKVVVEATDGEAQNAKDIINSMGGTIEDPNARIPKGLENINEDALILNNLND